MQPGSSGKTTLMLPVLSILIPASNEAGLIGSCLEALLKSVWKGDDRVEVIVIANGCRDTTVEIALSYKSHFSEKGWDFLVLDRKDGGKLAALNAGDHIARAGSRVYLDADVEVSELLVESLHGVLNTGSARYASGALILAKPQSWATRAYARVYEKVPFLKSGVPGAGLFAVNAAGRLRWEAFPNIISDDTFVRLNFHPHERIQVEAAYTWPLVEGWGNLVRVRKRQNDGVDEIKAQYPDLLKNDDKPGFPMIEKLRIAAADPIGFAVYAGVALAVKLAPTGVSGWSRGR
jgi:glycosyltransferase involved in cell wall biosynthesis